mmetsp:Transcript_2381/g.5994  ORF Transcript_2381/g.5994 Transcript_2381/m.5994 type:complete len:325 (+) Transcript_2381:186-1160(+)
MSDPCTQLPPLAPPSWASLLFAVPRLAAVSGWWLRAAGVCWRHVHHQLRRVGHGLLALVLRHGRHRHVERLLQVHVVQRHDAQPLHVVLCHTHDLVQVHQQRGVRALAQQGVVLGEVQQLAEQVAARGLALHARSGEAVRVDHQRAVLVVDALRALAHRLGHLLVLEPRRVLQRHHVLHSGLVELALAQQEPQVLAEDLRVVEPGAQAQSPDHGRVELRPLVRQHLGQLLHQPPVLVELALAVSLGRRELLPVPVACQRECADQHRGTRDRDGLAWVGGAHIRVCILRSALDGEWLDLFNDLSGHLLSDHLNLLLCLSLCCCRI